MCGIFGIVQLNNAVHDDFSTQFESIRHRGPDDSGVFVDYSPNLNVALGSVRLSIIDLSPAGHMPMANEDQNVWIAYNGELYNHNELRQPLIDRGHVYRSHTDTETIIHAYEEYGVDCLNLFNGMFAFALYDRSRGRVLLARDPMGIKPLYYHWDGSTFIFASELKTLLTFPQVRAEIEPTALEAYFSLGYLPSPYSMFKGVHKLQPGEFLLIENGTLRTHLYWTPEYKADSHVPSTEELIEQTRSVVEGAVKRQLMSDVPVGVFLSGGVDSSVITVLAQRFHQQTMDTFSVGFGDQHGMVDENSIYNLDFFHARRVAQQIGTRHHEVVVQSENEISDLLTQTVAYLDEPVWETSFMSLHLMSRLARQNGVIVVLTGDGGDELFAGYPWHAGIDRSERLSQLPLIVPAMQLLSAVGGDRTIAQKARQLLDKRNQDGVSKYRYMFDVFSHDQRSSLLLPDIRAQIHGDPVKERISTILDRSQDVLAGKIALADLTLWVREHFNQRVDRMTMMNSIEGRVPLQDQDVVNFALRLPIHAKMPMWRGKYLLRQAFADVLPENVLKRKKRPFSTPTLPWLRGALRPLVQETLSESRVREAGLLDPAAVSSIVTEFNNGNDQFAFRLWSLVIFHLWYDHYVGNRQPLSV